MHGYTKQLLETKCSYDMASTLNKLTVHIVDYLQFLHISYSTCSSGGNTLMMSSVSCDLCKRCIHGFRVFRNIIQFSASSIAYSCVHTVCTYVYDTIAYSCVHTVCTYVYDTIAYSCVHTVCTYVYDTIAYSCVHTVCTYVYDILYPIVVYIQYVHMYMIL